MLGGLAVAREANFINNPEVSAEAVGIATYDPNWPVMFAHEAERLRSALDTDLVVSIDHFGSTSIPGLAAKPVIDILIGVKNLESTQKRIVEPLDSLGYDLHAQNPISNALILVKGAPPRGARRTHIVHVAQSGVGRIWTGPMFRDLLRANPLVAAKYEQLKRVLAERYRLDRFSYTRAKREFIEGALARAARNRE